MKVQEVYSMAYETFEDVVENLPRLLEEVNHNKRGLRLRARLSQSTTVRERSFWGSRSNKRHDPVRPLGLF